ncbi:DUF1428 domain-containing protein [Desulfopila inferna]|uniref:DUF1428 domain-containing protein n=1 Tax=Desulfopila inferna TaxID=468528 RepID=UPI0019647508|nr:DUF1428 domain-containing protein [Desulfopila inferna]MBM9605750.1 DUF1428 domain-containing protein [Desulfopila inferna]
MERYVDGFVIPLPKDKVEEYKDIAEKAGSIWKEHGALEYWECLGDDLEIPDMVSFKKAANTEKNETVVFAWIVFESREHRDKVNAAVMADPRMGDMMQQGSEPFDYKQIVYGGFNTLVKM